MGLDGLQSWRSKGGETLPVSIKSSFGVSSGEIMIQRWGKGQRVFRAIRLAIVMGIITVVVALVPIAHFVLVPLALLIGVVMTIRALYQKEVIRGGLGTCPACGKGFEIFSGAAKWPIQDRCTECQRGVVISPVER